MAIVWQQPCTCSGRLHFPGCPHVADIKAIKGGNARHAGFAEDLEELLQGTYGTLPYSRWALGKYGVYCWWETRGSSVGCALQNTAGTVIISHSTLSKRPQCSKATTMGDSGSPDQHVLSSGGSGE